MLHFANKNISRSKTALENKDFQTSIKYCNDELKKNKRNVDVYLIRGSAYNQLGKTDLAIEDFKSAYQLDPSNIDILKKLFFSYAKIKDIQNSALVCNTIISQFPSDNDEFVYQEICRLLMEREQYENCLKLLTDIVQRSGEHHIFHHLMGLNYYHLNDFENAIKQFKKALKKESNIRYLLSLVECYHRINQSDKAHKELLKFWKEQHSIQDFDKEDKTSIISALADSCIKMLNFEEAINWYNDLLIIEESREGKIEIEHKKAHIYKMLKQYDKALEIYQIIIRTSSNSIKEFIECADIFKRQGKYKEAFEEYKKVLFLEPTNIYAILGIANICIMKHDYNQAHELLDIAYLNNKQNPIYLKQCADIYLELLDKEKNNEDKVANLKEKLYQMLPFLIQNHGQDIENYEKLIHLAISDEKYDYAKEIADKAVMFCPDNKSRLLQAYTLSYIDNQVGETYYETYLSYQGDKAEVSYYKAKYSYILGEFEEAFAYLTETLSLNEYHTMALELLVQVLFNLKQHDNALQVSERLISNNQYNAEYYYKCGIILARLKRYEDAIHYFKNAIMLNNFYLDAYYNLATVYYKLIDFDESLKCYKIIIYLNPDYNQDVYMKIAEIYKSGGR